VYRAFGPDGRIARDVVARADGPAEGEPLLQPVIRGGRLEPLPTLAEIRARCRVQLASLPEALRGLDPTAAFTPVYSDALVADAAALRRDHQGRTP
jgi:nicotinate phosphoribosyltransferase